MADGESEAGGGRRTPLRGALLGLLLERPGSGAELAGRLAARLGSTWRIEAKSVYRLLERLEHERLAGSRTEPRRGSERRLHVVYTPTERTEGALGEWMETLLPREPVRLGVHAKLAVAREQDVGRLLASLDQYERECLELLASLNSSGAGADSWSALMLECSQDSIRSILRAEIDWSRHTRERIGRYRESA
jgi:DNA-binding PadR family transcriptional regulator